MPRERAAGVDPARARSVQTPRCLFGKRRGSTQGQQSSSGAGAWLHPSRVINASISSPSRDQTARSMSPCGGVTRPDVESRLPNRRIAVIERSVIESSSNLAAPEAAGRAPSLREVTAARRDRSGMPLDRAASEVRALGASDSTYRGSSVRVEPGGCSGPSTNSEFLEDVLEVGADRGVGKREIRTDLGVRQTFGDEFQHLRLTRS
jgi:hypothetical protein